MKKLKLPKFALFAGRPKKLQATTAARRAPASDNYYEEEPKTNLSSAFIVVLVLHVVAVGGIYAFNSLRASRPIQKPSTEAASASAVGTPLAAKLNAATPAPENTGMKTATAPVSKTNVYHVQTGDTLTKIAAMNGVSVADLEEANGLKAGVVLRPNQPLTIPSTKPAVKPGASAVVQDSRKAAFLETKAASAPEVAATASSAARTYTVAKGDTPTSIAKKFGTTAADLLKLNKIDDPKKMLAGQTVKVPARKN